MSFRLVVLAALSLLSPACLHAQSTQPASVRIVGSEEQVQSRKRGICANKLHPEDFVALAPGVSWYYNWHFKGNQPPEGVPLEFVPMVWTDTPERLQGLRDYLAEGHRPRAILVANEPNLKGQAFIPPEQCADLHRRVHEITRHLDIPLVGPHMAIGSAPNASITAFDPIQQKELTYTFMVPYLRAFFHFLGDVPVDGVGVHSYKREGEVAWSVNLAYNEFKRPVWMTEYAWWAAPTELDSIRYLVKATDFLERSPRVEAYAWFKERIGRPHLRLLADEKGKLTPLGEAYVRMPVHDPDLYYRLPGRLNAARYVEQTDMEIDVAPDPADFLQMISIKPGATITYNVAVEQAGNYRLRLATAGQPGRVEVLVAGESAGSIEIEHASDPATTRPRGGAKPTLSGPLSLALKDGTTQLTLRFQNAGQSLSRLELAAE